MNAKYIVRELNLKVQHALYRKNGYWYHHLKSFPAILTDSGGYVLFDTKEAYDTSPYLQHGQTLHVKNGISSTPGYIPFSNEQLNKLVGFISTEKNDKETTIREKRLIDSILRNRKNVLEIKKLYENTCQICTLQLTIRTDTFYSEVHHIIPLGDPHRGPDTIANMICVCPNCHVQLDFGAIKLTSFRLKLARHKINGGYIKYHNRTIYKATNR